MNNDEDKAGRSAWKRVGYRTAFGTAIVAAVFSLVLCVQLVSNAFLAKAAPLQDSPQISDRLEQLKQRPGDEALKSDIRLLDLLARRAYFTGVASARRGAMLLLAGVLVMLIALKTMATLRRRLPDPGKWQEPDASADPGALTRWLVGAVGVALAIVALVSARVSGGVTPPARVPGGGIPAGTAQATGGVDYARREDLLRNWPCFRGVDGLGVAHWTNCPTEWDGKSGKNILWKSPVPKPGFSSPVVWEKNLFITGADTTNREVYCFDCDTGALAWRRPVAGIPGSPSKLPDVSSDTGYAASSAATDGKRVYAIFATGDLICFDFKGNRLWAKNVGVPENNYGHASSLITFEHMLIVQFDTGSGSRVLALSGKTGEILWETTREAVESWGTPVIVNRGTGMEIILNGNPFAAGYEPNFGGEVWQVKYVERTSVDVATSVAYACGRVFVANENACLAAIDPDAVEIVWKSEDGLPCVSSPLASDKFVFIASGGGTVTCHDAVKGGVLWTHDFGEGFYASPILVGGNVYLMDRSGKMRIFAADREFRSAGEPALGEQSVCTPAFLNGRIYIRGYNNLYCVGKKE